MVTAALLDIHKEEDDSKVRKGVGGACSYTDDGSGFHGSVPQPQDYFDLSPG